MEGEVVAVGPGARDADGKLHPLEVNTGDRVLSASGRAPRSSSMARTS
jgi:co-chaperonin GroES (HSP10)